jgi:hypothetical protein
MQLSESGQVVKGNIGIGEEVTVAVACVSGAVGKARFAKLVLATRGRRLPRKRSWSSAAKINFGFNSAKRSGVRRLAGASGAPGYCVRNSASAAFIPWGCQMAGHQKKNCGTGDRLKV